MSVSSAQVLDTSRALDALKWATDIAHGATPLLPAEKLRCSGEEWRALGVADVRSHVDQLLLGRQPDAGLDALLEIGWLDAWLPEVAAMVGFGDGEWRHKDVWKHTKQVVRQAVPKIEVRWGALLQPTPEDPPGFVVPSPPAWYRFVLQSPAVAVALMAANDRAELEEDLAVLDAIGPLPADEYERLAEHGRRVRRHAGGFP